MLSDKKQPSVAGRLIRRAIPIITVIILALIGIYYNPTPPDQYQRMVAQLRKGDTSIDFNKLRDAYLDSGDFDPNGMRIQAERAAMIADYDCEVGLPLAKKILRDSYINIRAHMLIAYCAKKEGDKKAHDFHQKVALSLLQSAKGGMTGNTGFDAYPVVTMDEVDTILWERNLKRISGSLLEEDKSIYVAKATGENSTQQVYFDMGKIAGSVRRKIKSDVKLPPSNR